MSRADGGDRSPRAGWFAAAAAAVTLAVAGIPQALAAQDGGKGRAAGATPYNVKCDDRGRDCAVDKGTYIGWRTYNGFCARCHGEGAVGSSFAPSLVERINRTNMAFAHFASVVSNGMSGQMGEMPAWRENPNVMNRINELWAFLLARADGVLAPGRPDKLGEEGVPSNAPSNWE